MSNFFKEIVDYQQIYNLSETIDWLFDDNKFLAENGWRPEAVGRLTKKIKKLPYFGKDNYKYDAVKNLRFPKRQCRTIKAFFSNEIANQRILFDIFAMGLRTEMQGVLI